MEKVMVDKDFLTKMDEKIQAIKKAALELKELSGGIQAVDRNADRILTSAKMLEINVSDVLEILSLNSTQREARNSSASQVGREVCVY
jgi:hypothetical protein